MFLQKRAWTVYGIAAAFKVSKATAQRDIDILRGLFKISVLPDPRHSQKVWYRMRGRFVAIL
jgi:predicted DNA-binding transcriptional regulator YafY